MISSPTGRPSTCTRTMRRKCSRASTPSRASPTTMTPPSLVSLSSRLNPWPNVYLVHIGVETGPLPKPLSNVYPRALACHWTAQLPVLLGEEGGMLATMVTSCAAAWSGRPCTQMHPPTPSLMISIPTPSESFYCFECHVWGGIEASGDQGPPPSRNHDLLMAVCMQAGT